MLLFGGNLTAGTKQKDDHTKNVSQQQEAEADNGGYSPRTDILHRLTNHELRLLEELERTRAKLQAEWRHKITELQAQGQLDEDQVPSMEQLERMVLLSTKPTDGSDVKAAMHTKTMTLSPTQQSKPFLPHKKTKKSKTTSDSLPRLFRPQMDMLPILTTTGQTPFEVGLAQSPSQHVLPVFRLPAVGNVQEKATEMTLKELEIIEEDREFQQASAALGLSVDEIEMLEAELTGTSNKKSSFSSMGSHSLMSKDTTGSSIGFPLDPKLPHVKKKQPRSKHKRKYETSSVKTASATALRKDLAVALSNVQQWTKMVKNDMEHVQRICSTSELRQTLFFKRWGREKVASIFRKLLYNFQSLAFTKWKQWMLHEKQQEKMTAYLMYKGTKKLDLFFMNWSQRKCRQAWIQWLSVVSQQQELEQIEAENHAVLVLQRAWRGFKARSFTALIKRQKLHALQTDAALKIQRMFRGSMARQLFRLKRLHLLRERAATAIQAVGRGYVARERVRAIRLEKRRHWAASKIQSLYRGRKVRKDVSARRDELQRTRAALIIQRRYRNRLGRAKYLRQQIERHRHRAATKIQTMARGHAARRLLRLLKDQDAKERARRHAAAIKIQKVYRGHRSRLGTELKLIALREKNKLRNKAATKIQTMVRAKLARIRVQRMREAHALQLLQMAKQWVEMWSEDANMWFYYDASTGQALWAPPMTGYTKANGDLVLQTGKLILAADVEDVNGLYQRAKDKLDADARRKQEEEDEERRRIELEEEMEEDSRCVECEEEDARRKCEQCEDVFCESCYDSLHKSSKREKHTWKAIGALRCVECEKMKATRWCYACQDPYCLGCFTIIHAKGNKSMHDWTDMATFKQQQRKRMEEESAQTYEEFKQTTDYQYMTELTAEEPLPTEANYDTDAAWTTQLDEASGQYYYYNTLTGESRWA